MKRVIEYLDESIFDKDLVKNDIIKGLDNPAELMYQADIWNDKKQNSKYRGGSYYVYNDLSKSNKYVCSVFDMFINEYGGGGLITRNKPDFTNVLKDIAIIQYIMNKYDLGLIDVIKYLEAAGVIKYYKYREIVNVDKPNVDLVRYINKNN